MTAILKSKLTFRHLAACGALLVFTAPLSAAERIQAGQWESVMTTNGEAKTVKYCMNAAKAASFNGDSKAGRDYAEKENGGRCAIKVFDLKGEKVSYVLVCGDRTIESNQTLRGDTSEGSTTTTVAGQAPSTTTLKSRRLGNCP